MKEIEITLLEDFHIPANKLSKGLVLKTSSIKITDFNYVVNHEGEYLEIPSESCKVIDAETLIGGGRYDNECEQLGVMAFNQLNLDKNRNKPDFEDMHFDDIVEKIDEEYSELREEICCFNIKLLEETYYNTINKIPVEKINFDNLMHETGDMAACLAGLIAWINQYKNKRRKDAI